MVLKNLKNGNLTRFNPFIPSLYRPQTEKKQASNSVKTGIPHTLQFLSGKINGSIPIGTIVSTTQ